jgi:hypothetical protein
VIVSTASVSLRRADQPDRLRGVEGAVVGMTFRRARSRLIGIRVTIAPGLFDTPLLARR